MGVKCDKFQMYTIKEKVQDLFSDSKSMKSTSTISVGLSSKQRSDFRSQNSKRSAQSS